MRLLARLGAVAAHYTSIPVPTCARHLNSNVMEGATAQDDALPKLRIPGLESIMQAPPLALQLSECALDDYPGFGPVHVEALLVFIHRFSKAYHQPRSQWICSIPVYVVSMPPEPSHSVAIERAIPVRREIDGDGTLQIGTKLGKDRVVNTMVDHLRTLLSLIRPGKPISQLKKAPRASHTADKITL